MHAFVILLNEGTFHDVPRVKVPLETGIPLTIGGKEAVVLGTRLTRAEAKSNGTAYYNRICKWHGEENTDWKFQTQDVESGRSSPDTKEKTVKRKREAEGAEGYDEDDRRRKRQKRF